MAKRTNRLKAALLGEMRASPWKGAILLAGIAVLIGLALRHSAAGAKDASAATADASVVTPLQVEDAAQPLAAVEFRPMPELARNLVRNPFSPSWLAGRISVSDVAAGSAKEEEADELTLQFTMTGHAAGDRPVAVISGTVVEVGMRVGAYVVEHIAERYVVLREGENMVQLKMR